MKNLQNEAQTDNLNLVASYLEIGMKISDQYVNIDWNDQDKKMQAAKDVRNVVPELLNASNDEIHNLYHLSRDYHRLEIIKNLILEISLLNKVLVIKKNNSMDKIIRDVLEFVKTGRSFKELISQSFWEENYKEGKNINFQETFRLLEIFR